MKLRHWYAVHGKIEVSPSPAKMLDSIRPGVTGWTHQFLITEGGWSEGVFQMVQSTNPLMLLKRYNRGDASAPWFQEGWEAELRKLDGPNCDYVVQHVRDTLQTVTITPIAWGIGPAKLARICEQMCGYLARETEGLIQVYQEGFFNAAGASVFPFCPKHKLKTS